jgi:hypothetical protein
VSQGPRQDAQLPLTISSRELTRPNVASIPSFFSARHRTPIAIKLIRVSSSADSRGLRGLNFGLFRE